MAKTPDTSVDLVIKAQRKAQKITQSDMARRLGLSLRQYQYLESGRAKITFNQARDILTSLNMCIIIVPQSSISIL